MRIKLHTDFTPALAISKPQALELRRMSSLNVSFFIHTQSVGKITKTEMNELNDALIRLGRNPIWNSNDVLRQMNVSRNYSPADSKLLVTSMLPDYFMFIRFLKL